MHLAGNLRNDHRNDTQHWFIMFKKINRPVSKMRHGIPECIAHNSKRTLADMEQRTGDEPRPERLEGSAAACRNGITQFHGLLGTRREP